jgi:hypothetical protein
MGKKRVPAKSTESGSQENAPTAGSELSTTVKTLQDVAQSLAATTAQMSQMMQQMADHASGTGSVQGAEAAPPATNARAAEDESGKGRVSEKNEEAKRFYERLEQTGQLADVDDKTDLSALPPHITHIRRPDGSIERIGFS